MGAAGAEVHIPNASENNKEKLPQSRRKKSGKKGGLEMPNVTRQDA